MAALKSAQGLHIDLASDAVVVVATLDAQKVALPAILVGRTDAAVAVLPVIALDDVGVDVQCGRFHQRIESFGVAVPLGHEQRVDLAPQFGPVPDIGQFAAVE